MTHSNRTFALSAAAVGCLLLSACALTDPTAELGVYQRQGLPNGDDDAAVAAGGQDMEADASSRDDGGPEHSDAGIADADALAVSADAGQLGELPCLATGCVLDHAIPQSQANRRCIQLTAHAPDSPDAPYTVSPGEHFVQFTSRLPEDASYLLSNQPIISNPLVLHYMNLYQAPVLAVPAGVTDSQAPLKDSHILYSWSPGDPSLHLAEGLGIPLSSEDTYALEVHYLNVYDGDGQLATTAPTDASGFELCVTSLAPPFPVSIAHLGKSPVTGTPALGTCTPQNPQPVQLLAFGARTSPENANLALTIERRTGERETVPLPAVDPEASGLRALEPLRMEAGDTLTASCAYPSAPGSFADALCQLNLLHWPAHALTSANSSQDFCYH
jgi:hypothetical protein